MILIKKMKNPKIIDIKERKLVGIRIKTSLFENRTSDLWRGFKARVKEIRGRLNEEFYSVQIFEEYLKFEDFNSNTEFEKWAAVEISELDNLPEGMEFHILKGGKYAVFIHKGTPDMFYKTSQYIFGVWLPNSEFELDKREHFEIMKKGYSPFDENAEEEIWIPIKSKV
jgi:AraC family transcriptional regulator